MDYLYELTLKHRELIEKKLAELQTDNHYVKCGGTSIEDRQSILELLSSLFLEFLGSEGNGEIGKELYFKEIQDLMAKGIDYNDFINLLNYIKYVIRDIVFEKAKDKSELYSCILQSDKAFDNLQRAIYNLWSSFKSNYSILKKIFELIPFGAFIYAENSFSHVNNVVERLTGYSSEELNAMCLKDLVHPDFHYLLIDDINKWLGSNELIIKRFECKILNKNGDEVWIDVSVGQIEMNGKQSLLATVLDVTDIKKIEKSLYKSERKYRTFFNFSPDMIYLIDMQNGMVEDANPMMLNTLGVTLAEIRSIKLKDFFAGDNLNELSSAFKSLKYGNELKGLEIKMKNKYGELIDLEVNCTPISENEQVVKVLCLARNVTERKKIEEIKKQAFESMKLLNETLEYDKVKTEFFSNLSHEFRTPLNVILGTLQIMDMFNYQDSNFTEDKVKKYSKIMKQNCYRLLRLVNNLIDLNKLDVGYMNLHMNNYDIVNIVAQISSSVADYIEDKGINFTFETKIKSKVIACDPDKMERIILNLLSNSVKFTESGGKIQVKLWEEQDRLFIAVKDTGSGIPKEKQDLVFKRFVQIDKSLSKIHQGSGIGLSLVKSLVELHEGCIKLISEEGKGCEFIIELPIKLIPIMEAKVEYAQYVSNNKIETINIEFSDIYS